LTRCALGRAGATPATVKSEGDGATPLGIWPLRRVLYRPDKVGEAPVTGLPALPLAPDDGWCDDPADRGYNTPVKRPYPASHEALWRDDGLYDVVVVLGHNDDPVIPGAGSAIFLHVAREGYAPTDGCVALAMADLLDLLKLAKPGDVLAVVE
jgi:L,D-peptidoglycan transpeptidase YkuD (ErfK/YbiS/YcfS/YnhG family)